MAIELYLKDGKKISCNTIELTANRCVVLNGMLTYPMENVDFWLVVKDRPVVPPVAPVVPTPTPEAPKKPEVEVKKAKK